MLLLFLISCNNVSDINKTENNNDSDNKPSVENTIKCLLKMDGKWLYPPQNPHCGWTFKKDGTFLYWYNENFSGETKGTWQVKNIDKIEIHYLSYKLSNDYDGAKPEDQTITLSDCNFLSVGTTKYSQNNNNNSSNNNQNSNSLSAENTTECLLNNDGRWIYKTAKYLFYSNKKIIYSDEDVAGSIYVAIGEWSIDNLNVVNIVWHEHYKDTKRIPKGLSPQQIKLSACNKFILGMAEYVNTKNMNLIHSNEINESAEKENVEGSTLNDKHNPEDCQKIVGKWSGTIGNKPLEIEITKVDNKNITSAYNLVAGKKRNMTGDVFITMGDWFLTLNEPGDDKWDGVFELKMEDDYVLAGMWKSNNGKLSQKVKIIKQ